MASTLTARRPQALPDRSFKVRTKRITPATAAIPRPARVIEAPSSLHGALTVVFSIPAMKTTKASENRPADTLPRDHAFAAFMLEMPKRSPSAARPLQGVVRPQWHVKDSHATTALTLDIGPTVSWV